MKYISTKLQQLQNIIETLHNKILQEGINIIAGSLRQLIYPFGGRDLRRGAKGAAGKFWLEQQLARQVADAANNKSIIKMIRIVFT